MLSAIPPFTCVFATSSDPLAVYALLGTALLLVLAALAWAVIPLFRIPSVTAHAALPEQETPPNPLIIELATDPVPEFRQELQQTDAELLREFDARLRECPGAAHLEAVTFAILKNHFHLAPTIHERPGTGGADFKLLPTADTPAYAECKYIDRSTVARMSGLPDAMTDSATSYEQITRKLQSTIGETVPQLSQSNDGPGIAVVGTDHALADLVMGWWAAEKLLTSTTVIRIPISRVTGSAAGPPHQFAELEDAAFLRPAHHPGEELDRRRLPASAALMVAFRMDILRVFIMGILNPWPVRPIDYRHFPGVPFARFVSQPSIASPTLPPVEFVVNRT